MWPAKITRLLTVAAWDSPDECGFYGAYNALLDFCFPWEDGWNIVPQIRQSSKSANVKTVFVITRGKDPFLFLEVNPADDINSKASRAAADSSMRDMFMALAETKNTHPAWLQCSWI